MAWLAGAGILLAVSILLKILAKKDTKQEGLSAGKSIGDGAVSEGELKFEGIRQKDSPSQSVGKGAKAKKDMSFTNIHQE